MSTEEPGPPQERVEEWKYPGPDPEELFRQLADVVEGAKVDKLKGPSHAVKKAEVELSLLTYLHKESQEKLAELVKAPGYESISKSIPPWKDEETVEQYLDRLTPRQQEIVLWRAQDNRTEMIALNCQSHIGVFKDSLPLSFQLKRAVGLI